MGLELATEAYYDNSGGLDLKSSPTKIAEDAASLSLNIDYSTDGALFTRNGSSIVNVVGVVPTPMSGNPATLLMFDYRKSDGTETPILTTADGKIKIGFPIPSNAVTGLAANTFPDTEYQTTPDDEYAFWGNGVDTNLKFNGTTWTNWSIAQPGNPTLGFNGAGTLNGTFSYYIAFVRYDVATGTIQQYSDLNPVAQTISPANQIVRITRPASPDSQVNGWVIYRVSPTSNGVYYQLIALNNAPIPIATTFYDDNNTTDGTVEAQFDNQAAPKSAVFEEYMGKMIIVDANSPTDYLVSNGDLPWNVPENSRTLLDGKIVCIRRIFGALFIGTTRSWWVVNGDPATTDPRRISSVLGVVNNRCAVGEDILYVLASNKKLYALSPTDFSQNEIRADAPLSTLIEPFISQIAASDSDKICMEYYTNPNVAKVVISCAIGGSTNSKLIIYNETQSNRKDKPVWQVWDNINTSALKQIVVNGVSNLYSADYNGLIWKLDDPSLNGDQGLINGTATSGSTTTLTDTSQTWTVNQFVGVTFRIIGGTGVDQSGVVISNTANTLTFAALATALDSTSQYTIGGYDVYHFSNWKYVVDSYDVLKQLWFLWVNANSSGSYQISLILQADFDQTISNQINLLLTLQAANAIWGGFIWGQAIWGSRSVFQDRLRQFLRFRSIRIGFYHRQAGQPFQINGFSLSAQNKGLLF